jgi:hypothetical protein
MYRLMRALSLLALVVAFACGGSSGNKTDAKGSGGSGSNTCTGGSACGEPCDDGNNLGIGKFCAKGSGQCASNNNAFVFCTVDVDSTAEPFCTGPCGSDADCGVDAFCDGSGGQNGCVPANCGGTPMGSGSGSA